MIRFTLLSFILLLAACANPAGYAPAPLDVPGAQATYAAAQQQQQLVAQRQQATAQAQQAAVSQATQAAVDATRQAEAIAQATAQAAAATSTALSETLAGQMTAQSIAITATQASIAAVATATDLETQAQIARQQAADEARRLEIQREEERIANEYRRTMNVVRPVLWAIAGLALLVFAAALAYRLYTLSRPVNIQAGNGEMITALPSGRYQIYAPRQAALPAPEPLALPGPERPIELPRMTIGHVLIAGETGSGKSNAMRAILGNRGNVIVLDPHNAPDEWGSLRVIGGGRNFDAIGEYMAYMRHELGERYTERERGRRDFEPLTVATDEMPAIVAALGNEIGETWREWLREGRKVGLFFAVSTQSTRVTTLGIKGEGDLLANFHYALVLGQLAEAEYRDMVAGMERPAVLRTIGGARPVVIPHVPAGQLAAGNGGGPLYIAPEPRGVNTEWGHISQGQMEHIAALARAGRSNSQIQTAVFDQNVPGGAAYHKVKFVLDYLARRNGGPHHE